VEKKKKQPQTVYLSESWTLPHDNVTATWPKKGGVERAGRELFVTRTIIEYEHQGRKKWGKDTTTGAFSLPKLPNGQRRGLVQGGETRERRQLPK